MQDKIQPRFLTHQNPILIEVDIDKMEYLSGRTWRLSYLKYSLFCPILLKRERNREEEFLSTDL